MYTIITNCSDSYYLIILDVPQNMIQLAASRANST